MACAHTCGHIHTAVDAGVRRRHTSKIGKFTEQIWLQSPLSAWQVRLDVSDVAATKEAVQNLGDIDAVVNNAGIANLQPFLELDVDKFDQVYLCNPSTLLYTTPKRGGPTSGCGSLKKGRRAGCSGSSEGMYGTRTMGKTGSFGRYRVD